MDSIVVFLASYLIFAVVLLAILAAYRTKKRREFIVALVLAGIIAWDLSAIAGSLFYNPRPFVSQNIEPLVAHGPDNGFPSQHTVLAMTLSAVIYFYWRRLAIMAFVLTLLVGAGRVWADVHSWIDIMGGLAIGAIAGYAGFKIAKFLLARLSARRPKVRR
jgi:undecaprenyl-diphosphatase